MKNSVKIDNIHRVFCENDNTRKVSCDICDRHAIDIYYRNHLKSETQISIFYRRQRLIITETTS